MTKGMTEESLATSASPYINKRILKKTNRVLTKLKRFTGRSHMSLLDAAVRDLESKLTNH
jgi:hypothetical protein